MATPTTVVGALAAAFAANQALAATPLWLGQAPEGAALSFVVLEHVREAPEWNSETWYLETSDVVFHCFAEGAANLDALQLAVKAAFDHLPLPVAAAQWVSTARTGYTMSPDERAADVGLVYHGAVSYQVRIARTPARPY